MGLGTDALLGAHVPIGALKDPALDSQNRFYGTVFMAYGPLLFLCATDIRAYASLFKILAWFLILAGIGRVISEVFCGMPSAFIVALLVIEVVVIPILLVWHARVLRSWS